MMKSRLMHLLISDLKKNLETEKITPPLVNQFALHDPIPNKWFDWEKRATADIMLIGQDWGPYVFLKKYVDSYQTKKHLPDFSYDKFLFESFSSRTEKFIMKALEQTYAQKHGVFKKEILNNIFFTVAVVFTRSGTKFRGSQNFNESKSFEISLPYLSRQISIVQPKLIITLGSLALKAVDRHFDLGLGKTNLTKVISSLESSQGVIKKNGTVIIPAFHPAAHISPQVQIKQWHRLWDNYLTIG